jgi:hypothetical protein
MGCHMITFELFRTPCNLEVRDTIHIHLVTVSLVSFIIGFLMTFLAPCRYVSIFFHRIMTDPSLLLGRVMYTVRSSAPSLNFQHPLVSLRSSSSSLLVVLSHLYFLLCAIQEHAIYGNSYARCHQFSQPSFFLLYVGCYCE